MSHRWDRGDYFPIVNSSHPTGYRIQAGSSLRNVVSRIHALSHVRLLRYFGIPRVVPRSFSMSGIFHPGRHTSLLPMRSNLDLHWTLGLCQHRHWSQHTHQLLLCIPQPLSTSPNFRQVSNSFVGEVIHTNQMLLTLPNWRGHRIAAASNDPDQGNLTSTSPGNTPNYLVQPEHQQIYRGSRPKAVNHKFHPGFPSRPLSKSTPGPARISQTPATVLEQWRFSCWEQLVHLSLSIKSHRWPNGYCHILWYIENKLCGSHLSLEYHLPTRW